MNIRTLRDLIDRFGDDLTCWPESDRAAAGDLLAESFDAQVALSDARRLRAVLTAAPIRAPTGLADRIFAAAFKTDVPRVIG